MNAADWVIVCVIVVSTLLSLMRGFTREGLSLVTWVLAILGARILSPSLSAMFIGTIVSPELRELAAFACLFLAILVVGMLVTHIIAESVSGSGLSAGDRLLGMAFGFARGILVVVVAIAFTSRWLAAEPWWQKSQFIPHLALFEGWTRETAYTISRAISG